jgi:hypothetical protein
MVARMPKVMIRFGKKALTNVIKKLLGGRDLLTSDCRVYSYKYNSVDKELSLDLQGKPVGSNPLLLVNLDLQGKPVGSNLLST